MSEAKNVIFKVKDEEPESEPVIMEFYLIPDGSLEAPNRITLMAKDKKAGLSYRILSFAPGCPIFCYAGIPAKLGLLLDGRGRVKVEED